MRIFAILAAFVCCTFSVAGNCADLGDGSSKSARRLDLLRRNFDSDIRAAHCPYGIVCAVSDGKTLVLEVGGIPENGKELKRAREKALPLGGSSFAATTFAAVNMATEGKIDFAWKVSERCSEFKAPRGSEKYATFENMLKMRAGFRAEEAKMLPKDSTPAQVFEFAGGTYANGSQGGKAVYSPLCAATVGYALGYETDKSEKNLKKSYAKFMKKYFFDKVGIAEPKYRGYDLPLFPSVAVALSPDECAKWLEAETRAPSDSLVAQRRISPTGSPYAMGWRDSSAGGLPAQITASVFQNCANEIAIFPAQKTAIAVFVVGDALAARGVCLKTIESFGEMLADIKNL